MGRTAVVTGGASGMGLGICEHLARAGHRVGVLDLDLDAAERAAAGIRTAGGEAMAAAVDVADRTAVDAALAAARTRLGPIEILVTSAGYAPFSPLLEITLDEWDKVLSVNLTGTFHCVQSALPDMVAGGWGRIVTISSTGGQMGTPNMAHYAAAKGGVIAFTKAVARAHARDGVTANTVPPMVVKTPMTVQAQAEGNLPSDDVVAATIPAGRLGTPDDIGVTCAFLCSDAASYITGQIIGVNGGALI